MDDGADALTEDLEAAMSDLLNIAVTFAPVG
jgi:hypothetical protein